MGSVSTSLSLEVLRCKVKLMMSPLWAPVRLEGMTCVGIPGIVPVPLAVQLTLTLPWLVRIRIQPPCSFPPAKLVGGGGGGDKTPAAFKETLTLRVVQVQGVSPESQLLLK